MTRAQKEAYVDALVTQLRSIKAGILTEYRGTSVAQMEELRKKFHEQGMGYKVAKNTLLKRALDKAGIEIGDPTLLDLPVALATSNDDEVTAAKVVTQVNKEIETIIPVGGIVNGSFVSASVIQTLAKLPGREELYAKMVGSLASLPGRMVRTLANPMQGLVTALHQVKAQKEA
jgi:large subunit ribosomal protein L10